MIGEFALISTKFKLFAGVLAVVTLAVTDEMIHHGTAEDYTVKGLLVAAVAYLARQIAMQQKEHKEDVKAAAEEHKLDLKQRDDENRKVLDANAIAMARVAEATEKQTEWFESIAKDAIRGNGHLGTSPSKH